MSDDTKRETRPAREYDVVERRAAREGAAPEAAAAGGAVLGDHIVARA